MNMVMRLRLTVQKTNCKKKKAKFSIKKKLNDETKKINFFKKTIKK